MMPHTLCIVGCGPGHPDWLTPIAQKCVDQVELLFGCSRALSLFPKFQGQVICTDGQWSAALERLERDWRSGLRIAVVVTGDVGLYSLAHTLRQRFGAAALRCIPGISSVQAACALLGIPWQSLVIHSMHGRTVTQHPHPNFDHVVLMGGPTSHPMAVEWTTALQLTHTAIVCRDVTLDSQSLHAFDPVDPSCLQGLCLLFLLRGDCPTGLCLTDPPSGWSAVPAERPNAPFPPTYPTEK